jgi:hypothetical protein
MVRLTAEAESIFIKFATPLAGETTLYGKTTPATRGWEPAMKNRDIRSISIEARP